MNTNNTDELDIRTCSCPLCKSKSKLLKGNTRRRYFCSNCYIEFTTDNNNHIKKVYEIGIGGDLDEITEWREYIKE